ncbi:CAP domain-containing protein [Pseudolabrys sp.]|uniref:CAP domain-containing protein n=1 Tax=Pseudolabrys sp. TaxID=1960880 RepID=UPI003D0C80C0
MAGKARDMREGIPRPALSFTATLAALLSMSAAVAAEDLNAFRAKNGRPPLAYSSTLAAIAQEQASSMARRGRLDHKNFRQRTRLVGTMAAENVSWGCDDAPCAIRQWSRSAGHRRNMLLTGVSHYGIASATAENGRRYWALELGGE